uniref:RING-type domain-containing protein n=1 Tax=Neogobius melanostomus TaxID=47308 RepID=A0A8C6T484_9GOBI
MISGELSHSLSNDSVIMAFRPEEDLTCLICQDIFKEPVVLSCSHSFCKDCLRSWWREKPTRECPVCKRRSSKSDPPRNLALRNLCEAYVQQREQKTPEEQVCRVHSERLKLFCLTDQQPVFFGGHNHPLISILPQKYDQKCVNRAATLNWCVRTQKWVIELFPVGHEAL